MPTNNPPNFSIQPIEINGSQVPASFSIGQLIGGTALSTLRKTEYNQYSSKFGIETTFLSTMNSRGAATRIQDNKIYELPPAPGVSEAELQSLYSDFIRTNGTLFRSETGLYDQDIINMFRVSSNQKKNTCPTSRPKR